MEWALPLISIFTLKTYLRVSFYAFVRKKNLFYLDEISELDEYEDRLDEKEENEK